VESEIDQKEYRSQPSGPSDGLGERDRDEGKVITKNDKDRGLVPQKLLEIIKEIRDQDQENERERAEKDRHQKLSYKIAVQDFQRGSPLRFLRNPYISREESESQTVFLGTLDSAGKRKEVDAPGAVRFERPGDFIGSSACGENIINQQERTAGGLSGVTHFESPIDIDCPFFSVQK